jgi:hypothetical protein
MKFAMQDGRIFTSYDTNATLNKSLQEKYKTTDLHAFRHYLQANAEKVMDDVKQNTPNLSCDAKSCPICFTPLKI